MDRPWPVGGAARSRTGPPCRLDSGCGRAIRRSCLTVRWPAIGLALVHSAMMPDIAAACPNCVEALAAAGRAAGYALGVGLMLATPFTLALIWGIQIRRLVQGVDVRDGERRDR